jgi:NAD(P)-dependent dehydrogenase (short-subunit alcohol dehydrogenase family)
MTLAVIQVVQRSGKRKTFGFPSFDSVADHLFCRFPCDVSKKESIAELAAAICSRETHLDVLISNAGIRRDPPIACNVLSAPLAELQASMWSSRHSDWADTFCVNTTAHYFLSVAMLPLLAAASQGSSANGLLGREDGRGAIVLTSSCASMHNATNIDLTSYATSKAATDHLVKLLAAKFSRFYVRVVGINPGCESFMEAALRRLVKLICTIVVPSKMNPVGEAGNMFSSLFDRVPARRAGNEEDIAGTVIFLASRAGVRFTPLLRAMPRFYYAKVVTGLYRWGFPLC